MRKILATVALVTALASPAFAQSYDPSIGTGNIAPVPGGQTAWSGSTQGVAGAGASAFARAVPGVDTARGRSVRPAATDDSHAVMSGGRMLGRDPDPFIRSQILRLRGGNHPG